MKAQKIVTSECNLLISFNYRRNLGNCANVFFTHHVTIKDRDIVAKDRDIVANNNNYYY